MLRFPGNTIGAGFTRRSMPIFEPSQTEPRNTWDRAERILEILARNPIEPPAVPRGTAAALASPQPAWQPVGFEPRPFPSPPPGSVPIHTWEFDPAKGDRPLEHMLHDLGHPADGGIGAADPSYTGESWPQDDGDQPPRIIAVMPHRSDRNMAEDILATVERNDAAHAAADQVDSYSDYRDETAGSFQQQPNTQVAQVLNPWNPFDNSQALANADESGAALPINWKNGRPSWLQKNPLDQGFEGYIGPRGGGGSRSSAQSPKSPTAELQQNPQPSQTPSVVVPRDRYPQGAEHIEDAINKGAPNTLTIDRNGATARRSAAQQGTAKARI